MNRSAFTLIELLIVVGIIGIITAIAVPTYRDATIRSRVAQAQMDLRNVAQALNTYRLDHNIFPRRQNELNFFAVFLLPDLTSPIAYLGNPSMKDPFGKVEEYIPPREDLGAEYVGLVKDSYTYTPYVSFSRLQGRPEYMKEGFALSSIGPDKQDSYIVDFPFPDAYRLPGDSVRDSVYDPSNGIISPGDIGYFGGDLSYQGLLGG